MDRLTPATADPAARLYAAFMAGAPSDPVLDVLANLCVRSLRRIDELDAVAAAKRALAHRAVCATTQPEGSGGDLSLILAESDGLLAGIDARQIAHARNLRQTISMAQKLTRSLSAPAALPTLPRELQTSRGCTNYLHAFQLRSGLKCRKCGGGRFARLVVRPLLQCMDCSTQVSCRCRTVMENSRLALPKWFGAIQLMLVRPLITSEELAAHIALSRVETARSLKGRFRWAMRQPIRSTLIAGLDEFFSTAPAVNARVLDSERDAQSTAVPGRNSISEPPLGSIEPEH